MKTNLLLLQLLVLLGTAANEPLAGDATLGDNFGEEQDQALLDSEYLEIDDPESDNGAVDDILTRDDKLLATTHSRNLQDTPWCSSDVLDFDTAGELGTYLDHGDYVKHDEWRKSHGVRVFARGRNGSGYTPSNMARLYGSSTSGEMSQLGSPNRRCRTRGRPFPGSGSGGFPGQPGENCRRLGNVLIIQRDEAFGPAPANNADGGVITFVFDLPTNVTSMGLLNINTASSNIYVTREDGSRRPIRVPRLGLNSVQTVPIFQPNALKVQVSLRFRGAVTHLTFCPNPRPMSPTTPRPTPSSACRPNVVESEEDFEDGSLVGWINGRLTSNAAFTNFLGRFVKDTPDPSKVYRVAANAEVVVVQFDFYEIDSWNSKNRFGPDKVFVSIDGEVLDLGTFKHSRDEGVKQHSTPNGIVWERRSLGPPSNIGFRGRGETLFRDQIHHVTAIVPPSFFRTDSLVTLAFHTRVTARTTTDECSGFDNIVITSKFDCGGVLSSAPPPTLQPTTNPTGSICGTVSVDGGDDNNQGTPIFLARVVLDRVEPWEVGFDFTLISAEGQYCFTDLPLGQYRLSLKHSATLITPANGESLVTLGSGNPLISTANDFVIEPFRKISGRVLADIDFDGIGDNGIRSVSLEITGANSELRRITTDLAGRFEATGLPGGEYLVRPDSYVTFRDATFVNTADPTGIQVDLAAGDALSLIFVFRRRPTQPTPQPLGSICGAVCVDADNDNESDGFERRFVAFLALHGPPPLNNLLETVSPSVSNGRYCFNDVPLGDYTVVANLERGIGSVSPSNGEIGVRIGLGYPVNSTGNDFLVERLRCISGKILIDTNGDGIGDVEFDVAVGDISVKVIGRVATRTSDWPGTGGSFKIPDLPPGEYVVRVERFYTRDGATFMVLGDPNGIRVDLSTGDATDLSFVVRPHQPAPSPRDRTARPTRPTSTQRPTVKTPAPSPNPTSLRRPTTRPTPQATHPRPTPRRTRRPVGTLPPTIIS